jgi:hypothetical protein
MDRLDETTKKYTDSDSSAGVVGINRLDGYFVVTLNGEIVEDKAT